MRGEPCVSWTLGAEKPKEAKSGLGSCMYVRGMQVISISDPGVG